MILPKTVERELLIKLKGALWYKGSIKACCLFHDEITPSMFISQGEDAWFYYCFGCNKGGHINHIFKILKIDFLFPEKPKHQLKKKTEFIIPIKQDETLGFPDIYEYFIFRGVSKEICKKFKFKFSLDENAAIMPVYTNRIYMGYIARYLTGKIRYKISSGMVVKRSLWAFDAVDKTKPTYVVEGIIDAAILWSHGKQAIALLGKQWKEKLDLLEVLEQPIFLPDNFDVDSHRIFMEMKRKIGGRIIYLPPKYKDIGELHDTSIIQDLP